MPGCYIPTLRTKERECWQEKIEKKSFCKLLSPKPAKENNLEEDRTGLEMKSGWKILGGRGMIRKAFGIACLSFSLCSTLLSFRSALLICPLISQFLSPVICHPSILSSINSYSHYFSFPNLYLLSFDVF